MIFSLYHKWVKVKHTLFTKRWYFLSTKRHKYNWLPETCGNSCLARRLYADRFPNECYSHIRVHCFFRFLSTTRQYSSFLTRLLYDPDSKLFRTLNNTASFCDKQCSIGYPYKNVWLLTCRVQTILWKVWQKDSESNISLALNQSQCDVLINLFHLYAQ